MIDIHSHILPGIDDGSKSLDQSVELCKIAAGDGIKTIVCTPHIDFRYTNRRETIEGPFAALQRACAEQDVPLVLVRGAEVHMAADILSKLRQGELVTYDDRGKYLLLEFPFQQVLPGAEEMVYRLRLAGVTPIIAHPERIGHFMDDADRLFNLIRLGALGQVTGGSLLGQFGEKSRRSAMIMIERFLVHIVASDAHDPSYRRPVLAEAADEVAGRFGSLRAQQMSVEYPQAVVAGAEFDPPPPQQAPKRLQGFLSRLMPRSRG